MAGRRTTTKDVALLKQLYEDEQLVLAPEFQRSSVWPRAAKAYLIDTILRGRPIPPLFFERRMSAQVGRNVYRVIDGQQRLRAVFDFLANRFSLTQSPGMRWEGRRFRGLSPADQDLITDYDFIIEELSGYTQADIEDIFARVNRYVVQLNAQEIRHAREHGRFAEFAEQLGALAFWRDYRVFTPFQVRRMRPIEFSAELTILLSEGPQDKKASINLWYSKYRDEFPDGPELRAKLERYLSWIVAALPSLASSRFRKPIELYSLIGALDIASDEGDRLEILDPGAAGQRLRHFETLTKRTRPAGEASRYLVAASRQTDNLIPRTTRISIVESILTA